MRAYRSWGRYPRGDQIGIAPRFKDEVNDVLRGCQAGSLPFGNGRSYGDSCRAASGFVIDTGGLNRIEAFNSQTGRVVCEAGVLLNEITSLVLPSGWFLPVTPGTQYVSIGGAIANDVHGKNHHSAGSFSDHVVAFEIARSDKDLQRCSRTENSELFSATIGGLGLTGVIVSVELQLKPVRGPWLQVETIKFGSLSEFFAISSSSVLDWEYTVAWIDCIAQGKNLGRGHFIRANHVGPIEKRLPRTRKSISVPFAPVSIVNRFSLRVFNELYYHRLRSPRAEGLQHFTSYFYPLDGLKNWNRLYGAKGFHQFQCVFPPENAKQGCASVLRAISASGEGSFLAVLKQFGERVPQGILSFVRPGTTMALDFPARGARTRALLASLDSIVEELGGALYPAKDAHMTSSVFKQGFPRWAELEAIRDPVLCSEFWCRVALADVKQ